MLLKSIVSEQLKVEFKNMSRTQVSLLLALLNFILLMNVKANHLELISIDLCLIEFN